MPAFGSKPITMRRIIDRAFPLRLLVAAFVVLFLTRTTEAHDPRYGIGTLTLIKVEEERVLLFFDLSYDSSWAQAEMIAMDRDRSTRVEEAEAERYLDRIWREKVEPNLLVKLDGEIVRPVVLAREAEGLLGEIYPRRFSVFYHLEARFPESSAPRDGHRELIVEDKVIRGETPGLPLFVLPFAHHGAREDQRVDAQFIEPSVVQFDARTLSNVLETERIRVELRLEDGDPAFGELASPWPWRDPNAPPPAPSMRAARDDGDATLASSSATAPASRFPREDRAASGLANGAREDAIFGAFSRAVLETDAANGWALVSILAAAILWGIAHAFLPGHGKSMVAAYLSGTRGRVRDAALLGGLTALSHTLTVFAIGVVVYWIASTSTRSAGSLENVAVVVFSLISGLFLIVLGLVLFFRRHGRLRRGAHHSAHPCSHTHTHAHEHKGHIASRRREGEEHERRAGSELASAPIVEPRSRAEAHGEPRTNAHSGEDVAQGSIDAPKLRSSSFPCESPRLRDMLALSFSGGLRPCPFGLAIIAIGLQYPDRFVIALLALLFFSLGLGAVLVAIGILMVTGRSLAEENVERGSLLQRIPLLRRLLPAQALARFDGCFVRGLRAVPVFSCLVVVAIGAFFAARSIRQGSTELLAALDGVRRWLGL